MYALYFPVFQISIFLLLLKTGKLNNMWQLCISDPLSSLEFVLDLILVSVVFFFVVVLVVLLFLLFLLFIL